MLGREIARADPSAVRRVDLDSLKAAAAAGRLPADAGAPAVEHLRDRATLDALGELLLDALEKLLREATEPAVVMRDAALFNQRAHASAVPEWRRAGPFAGYGVEQPTGGYSADASWRFLPVGHPVQRLIAAATDPELEPIAEPEPAPAAASKGGTE